MKRKEKFYTEEQKEIFKFGKILFGLVLVIGLLYLFTVYVVNKEDKYERTNNKGVINYNNIMIGTLLNRLDNEYYVLIYDDSKSNNALYLSKINEYKTKTNHLPVYMADLSNELNKSYIDSKSNYKVDSVEDLKVKGTTLVKVKAGKITKFIKSKEAILDELN